jgi:fatty-acyl-CoA synthase
MLTYVSDTALMVDARAAGATWWRRSSRKDCSVSLADLGIVARTIFRSGVVRPTSPRKLIAARKELRRWGLSFAGALAASSALHPTDTFIVDDRGPLTRAEMQRRTNALAHGLRAQGVQAGDLVGVLARNHRGFVEVSVALGKVGARTLYLNTGFAGPQLREVLERERPAALIYDEEFDQAIGVGTDVPIKVLSFVTDAGPSNAEAVTIDTLIATFPGDEPEPPTEIGEAIILTSGTTGAPKGATREQQTSARPGIAMLERIPYRHGDVTLVSAPLFHSWGFGNLALGLLLNATVVLRRTFDPEEVLATIADHRVTVLAAVPVMLRRILDLPPEVRARYDTSSLRVVALSGSSIPAGLVTEWMDAYGDNIYNLYGSTEVGWVTIASPQDLREDPRTAGRPPLYTEVRLLDAAGKPVRDGDAGRIFVKSPLLFGGYTDGQTKEVIDGYMSTGDTGRFDEHGRLRVEGRDDEMIVSGGENVFPREVEDLLSGHRDVADVAVIGVPDEQFGQRLKAYVVRRPQSTLDADAVRAFVHENLARYKTPRDVEFVDEIPRNATGKILKRNLAAGSRGST